MIARSLTHTIGVLTGREQPHTQTTPEERALLFNYLPGAKTIVEIGVYEGATTALLAAHADPDAVVYGVDPMFTGRLGVCWGEVVAKHVTRHARSKGRVRFIKCLSHEAADQITGMIDLIFLDGDHSIEGIRRDWETWTPRVKLGGIMALHDSYPAPNSSPTLGSQKFFADVVTKDDRFVEIAQEASLAILRRVQ